MRVGVAAVALALVLAAPLAASAHVHVDPENAEPGEYALLTFRVPNESATAATTSVEIQLPTDTPFSYAAVEPVDGWTAQVVTSELPAPVDVDGTTISTAPTSIRFTATGAGIGDGEFQRFTVSVGAVPDTGSILLPVVQTYSDGSVSSWTDPTPASGVEPEFPAPTLYITDEAPAGDSHGGASVHADDGEHAETSAGQSSSDSTGLVVGFLGLGVAAVALVVSGLALARSRRAASPRKKA